MAFFIASSPHHHNLKRTQDLMKSVILCTIPGILALLYFFGWGVIVQITLASLTAVLSEAVILKLRKRPIIRTIQDNSALLTGILIGIAIPPLAPWWVAVIGSLFAIIIAKHLYGGIGQNPFNPAMIAYVVLLISFPVQMTTWLPPLSLMVDSISITDVFHAIFRGFSADGFSVNQLRLNVDAVTMATPLDTIKTALSSGQTLSEALMNPVFSIFTGKGWIWVNAAFLLGGIALLKLRIIQWQIPFGFLISLFICASLGYTINPDQYATPIFHLFSGASMLGAFFIATDPVSAATTPRGRLVFGAMIGVLVYLIRTLGGFPDGVAFAVLLANMCVPLIDQYTKPIVYGYKE